MAVREQQPQRRLTASAALRQGPRLVGAVSSPPSSAQQQEQTGSQRRFRSPIRGLVFALLAFGCIMVLSSSSIIAYGATHNAYAYFEKQVLWVSLGLIAMEITSRIDYRRWRRLGLPLLALSVLGLVVVLATPVSTTAYGATRWIPLPGGVGLQPSEVAKLGLLLFGADVLARKRRVLRDVRHLLIPVLPVTAILAVLVMLQPDLGTTLLLCAIAVALLFLADGPLAPLLIVAGLGLAAGFALIMAQPYRRARLLSFLHPGANPLGAGYQVLQGRLALGSGGLFGVGLGASRQQWLYLPNAHTDFIFAIVGEELGVVGALSLVVVFAWLVFAGLRVTRRAPDLYGRLVSGGATVWIAVQTLVNMGAVVGVLPVTGVPLPFISFGGSSLIVLLIAVGLILAVEARTLNAAPPSSRLDRWLGRLLPFTNPSVQGPSTDRFRSERPR